MKPEKMDLYICKNCDQSFKAYGQLPNNAQFCPYCGEHSLFNVSFEERMGTFDK